MTDIQNIQLEDGIEYIKIHGLQRTCTNYLTELINNNFENTQCLVNAGGWKHGHYCAPWTLGREVHVVIATKNPYAWLTSLFLYWLVGPTGPDLTNTTFEQFIKQPVVFEEAAGTPYLLTASNPIQYWNNMNFHWMSIRMNAKKSLVIPHEALFVNTEGIMQLLATEWGVVRKPFYDCNYCLPGQEKPKVSDIRFHKEYYQSEQYLMMYTPELFEFVNSQLDDSVMNKLGYVKRTN